MSHIKVLDQITIDKIAAGEVIERPASIVKELTENAIDAGADSVTVEIEDGGITLIRISDNGSGIEREDIHNAFLRHSTSKIESVDDLMHISSLGFRGEALSSIAAVTKVELITKPKEDTFGTRYVIEGGKEISMEDTGASDGTTFLVRQLFYNVPARRKFLKTPMTEAGHVQDCLLYTSKTAMGARMLRKFIEQPLIEKQEILRRLDAVEELKQSAISREEIREYLSPVYDLERLITRITYGTANPRDLTAFAGSLSMLPPIRYLLEEMESSLLKDIYAELDPLEDLCTLVQNAIADEPPLAMKEGGIIRDGYNEEIDTLRRAKSEGKDWLAKLEQDEREKTGIKTLRIKYNKVFGYYLEVTNSYKELVPDYYTRKQTLANAERYITPELKELEDTILGAEDKLYALEYELYCTIRDTIAAEVKRIQTTAKAIASLDVFSSLAFVAERNNYVRPKINESGKIDIRDGRHPVVEQMIPNGTFICNDTLLDDKKQRVSIITGPNMAGKSTYMRQAALIVLMAQIGSFVPASGADIGLVDRIFTRVGASDDLASGQSTFMVEMTEVANILRNATSKSLLILDEIGRGTSTFDGLSIAWAVVEYISDSKLLGAKTLFATHYHELTELEGKIDNVNNYCIAVKEKGDDIVFLRKIVKGGADKSYGIQVAKLAGVPDLVIDRAKEIVEELVNEDITIRVSEIAVGGKDSGAKKKAKPKKYDEMDLAQFSLFDTVKDDDVLEELKNIDVGNLTPVDALNTIYRLQNKLKNRW